MGLSVTLVSGLRRAGKSMLIRVMIDCLWQRTKPHYIRLAKAGGDKHRPLRHARGPKEWGVASARWLEYDDERVFEVLPEALTAIHRQDRFGSVVVEADADPAVRCAYPYDHRIFVMPVPASVREVFRDSRHAAQELQRVLDDTAAFASEMFGLFSESESEDCDPSEDRARLSASDMRSFLYSPLGDELATRIQLQQPFHGLVESDVVLVNTQVRKPGPESEACLRRIARLLERTRRVSGRDEDLFLLDPLNGDTELRGRLLDALKPMCVGGT